MVHDMMQRVAKADRRMKLMTDLEFTLTAKDKEALVADMTALAAEKNAEGASFSASDVPSSCVPPRRMPLFFHALRRSHQPYSPTHECESLQLQGHTRMLSPAG